MIISGYDHGARRVGVRTVVLVLPSVGCTNHVVELARRRIGGIRILTHQHGCGQLGDDLGVTRELLARTCAHPNVQAAVIIGLGCESNQPSSLSRRAMELGATVRVCGLQECGGATATVAAVAAAVAEFHGDPPRRRQITTADLSVGLLRDPTSGDAGRRLSELMTEHLVAEGATVVDAGVTHGETRQSEQVTGIPEAWRHLGLHVAADSVMAARSTDETETLSLVAGAGAHVVVVITGRVTTVGSPVAPTVKVCTDPALGRRLPGLFDLVAEPLESSPSLSRRVLDSVEATAAGAPTAAERAGQRDFGIPRFAPSM